MGLGNMQNVQKCAFASSFIASYHSTLKSEFGLDRLLASEVDRRGIRHVEEFCEIFEEFHILKPDFFQTWNVF